MKASKKKLVLINDHQFLSDILISILREMGFGISCSFTNPIEALSFILSNEPDLVIIDMMLPVYKTRTGESVSIYHPYILMDGQVALRTIRKIREGCKNTKIIILNGERHPNTYLLGFESGANGIASKLEGYKSFAGILKRVMEGGNWITSPRMKKVLDDYRDLPIPSLSAHEIEILEFVQEGLESAEIGRKMGYSQRTIRNTLSKINEKFGTSNRFQALNLAVDMGLVGWRISEEKR